MALKEIERDGVGYFQMTGAGDGRGTAVYGITRDDAVAVTLTIGEFERKAALDPRLLRIEAGRREHRFRVFAAVFTAAEAATPDAFSASVDLANRTSIGFGQDSGRITDEIE